MFHISFLNYTRFGQHNLSSNVLKNVILGFNSYEKQGIFVLIIGWSLPQIFWCFSIDNLPRVMYEIIPLHPLFPSWRSSPIQCMGVWQFFFWILAIFPCIYGEKSVFSILSLPTRYLKKCSFLQNHHFIPKRLYIFLWFPNLSLLITHDQIF